MSLAFARGDEQIPLGTQTVHSPAKIKVKKGLGETD